MLLGTGAGGRCHLAHHQTWPLDLSEMKWLLEKKSSLFKRKKWIHIKLIIILFTGLVYAKIILGASFCNGLLVSVLSSLIPTLNGIYSLSLLCANGNLNSLDLAKKMHALICLPHWGRVTSFGYLFELF